MENRSFEESPRDSRPRNPMDNPPGPSKPRADPFGEKYENIPHIDDEDNESPPAHVQRYMPKKKNIQDDLEDLEPPSTDPVPGPHDDRLNPELVAAARKRKQLRINQLAAEGPCHLRPDSPNVPPLAVPEQHPDPDHQIEQGANADNPEQQGANAGNPEQQGEQGATEPEAGQQADNAPVHDPTWKRIYLSCRDSFNFQFALHTVLLVLPMMTAIMGVLTADEQKCNINYYLPFVMIAIGSFGTMTVANRLYAINYQRNFPNSDIECWWNLVRLMEIITWMGIVVEIGLFFWQAPSYDPAKTPYCMPYIYRMNCVLISMKVIVILGWVVVHVILSGLDENDGEMSN